MSYVEQGRRIGLSEDSQQEYLRGVFNWMFLALALTSVVAFVVSRTSIVDVFLDSGGAILALFAVQLALVFGLSFAMPRISAGTATLLFFVYAGVTGITFGVLLAVYTTASVVGAFAGACGLFGGMAVWGHTTKKDLSGWGSILFGAVIGILIASVVNVFIGGEALNFVIGVAGVVIFSALTAYDMQKIKTIGAQGFASAEDERKSAIFGALALYLDFVNLVISLLRIFGSRR